METLENDNSATQSSSPLSNPETWKRGLAMLVFMVALGIGQSILFLVSLVQFVWLLFKQVPNRPLAEFGRSLASWLSETARFLTCATEEKPFPFQAWPRGD
jgi:hypothetical protein